MRRTEKEIEHMYRRFLDGQCTSDELQELLDYFEEQNIESPLAETIGRELRSSTNLTESVHIRATKIVEKTDSFLEMVLFNPEKPKLIKPVWIYRTIAAASLILSLGLLIWYAIHNMQKVDQLSFSKYGVDILPGGKKASLVLSDGRTYELDATENEIMITDNQVYYGSGVALTSRLEDVKATVYAPRGGEYKVLLSDGSEVWLNADSKLTYPLSFSSNTRRVELEGEAYFRIKHNPDKPFFVTSKGQQIKVLGTEFVVRSYPDEKVQTTLVSGRVDVYMAGHPNIELSPGQQLSVYKNQQELRQVNVEAYTGWKNSMFIFHDIPLSAILPQLARWYDIDVPTVGIPEIKVFGEINRNTKLSEVLSLLETATDLRFKIEERRLLIQSK